MRPPTAFVNVQKQRRGLDRLRHALGHSLSGLRAGWTESAFRQEAGAAVVLVPVACWLGRTWFEAAVLAASVFAVMAVELLNSGIEAAIDRVGPELHPLSRRAKDLGSAAVLLSLVGTGLLWLGALVQRLG